MVIVDFNSALGLLHHVGVRDLADVSEEHAVSSMYLRNVGHIAYIYTVQQPNKRINVNKLS
jgi:hypothetical protein